MVGANVNAMEEQVAQAEGELGSLPGAFKKILRTVPSFLNVSVRIFFHKIYTTGKTFGLIFMLHLLLFFRNSPVLDDQQHISDRKCPVFFDLTIISHSNLNSDAVRDINPV